MFFIRSTCDLFLLDAGRFESACGERLLFAFAAHMYSALWYGNGAAERLILFARSVVV